MECDYVRLCVIDDCIVDVVDCVCGVDGVCGAAVAAWWQSLDRLRACALCAEYATPTPGVHCCA